MPLPILLWGADVPMPIKTNDRFALHSLAHSPFVTDFAYLTAALLAPSVETAR